MQSGSFDWMRRARWLTRALLISGALNVTFLAAVIYFSLKRSDLSFFFEFKPVAAREEVAVERSEELFRAYSLLPFQELLLLLEEGELIEAGYSRRDFALASLVAFHHFNLEKAVGGAPVQRRKFFLKNADGRERIELNLFPGLSEEQYRAITHFAKTERWPLTSKGLFFEMQRTMAPRDPTLLEAFYHAPEFHSVLTLFTRGGISIEKEQLVELLLPGEWELLEKFALQQRETQDLSSQRLVTFLLDYAERSSSLAAHFFVEVGWEAALQRLSDPQVLLLLDLLTEKTERVELFAKELLVSPRSDAVWKKAALKLFTLAGETPPDPYDHTLVLNRFAPRAVVKTASLLPHKPSKRVHIVTQGESLWKIARKYHTSIEAIMEANHLKTEKLRPGKELMIPDG